MTEEITTAKRRPKRGAYRKQALEAFWGKFNRLAFFINSAGTVLFIIGYALAAFAPSAFGPTFILLYLGGSLSAGGFLLSILALFKSKSDKWKNRSILQLLLIGRSAFS